MPEHLTFVSLAEIDKVRIGCKQCQMQWTVSIDSLHKFKSEYCEYCDAPLRNSSDSANDPYRMLARAIKDFTRHSGVSVDLVMESKD